MTREEAIKAFQDMKRGLYPFYPNEYFDMAIKALEQEPKFIAKSDGTIEQIKNCNGCVFRKEWEKIGKLLSVVLEKQTEQEPKTGHWIFKQFDEETGILNNYWCSECGKPLAQVYKTYCSNCGAKMVEPQESEKTK